MKKSIFTIAMLALAIAGCRQMEEVSPQGTPSESVVYVAHTEAYGSSTRTALNAAGNIIWSAADQIAIFEGGTAASQYEVNTGDGTSYAEFTVVDNSGSGEIEGDWARAVSESFDANVAFYPYTAGLSCTAAVENETLVSCTVNGITLPSVQQYVANSFPEEAFPMVAITGGASDRELKFKNVGGALKLQLTGTAAIKSISLAGNAEEPLAGDATVTVYTDGTTKPQITMATNAAKGVTLSCGEQGVQLNEETPTTFIIATPPTSFASGFTLTLANTAGQTTTLSTTKPNAIDRSMILAMPVCKVEFKAAETASDLSANGTANCYIVTKAGNYKFKATQGCSDAAVGAASASSFTHPEGTPTEAAVVWESFGTSTSPTAGDLIKADVEYKDGYVHFSTADTFTEGNAVIAVKDANGVILWSWHIWLTDQPAEQVYRNNAGTLMDRNLGATSATAGDVGALGLFYQWGRKDPFLGSNGIQSTTMAASTKKYSTRSSDADYGTVAYTINNPNTFIYSDTKDWLYYASDTEADTSRWGSEKTIYDPCPAGWQVPDLSTFTNANRDSGASSCSGDGNEDRTNLGWNMQAFGTDASIWYPCAGYFNSNLKSVGVFGQWWTTSTSDLSYNFRIFQIWIKQDLTLNCQYVFNLRTAAKVAYSVRCVKISE